MALNFYAVNKILGGTMVPAGRQQFGGFGTMRAVGDMLRHRPRKPKSVPVTMEMDRLVAEAFEQVREGKSPERILWDEKLAGRFHAAARRLGVHAPAPQLDRRLINLRKNPARYRRRGIELSATEVRDPQPSVVPQFAHALEFALVRLRNRYGASIDDILLDPDLVREYEGLARRVAKSLTSRELRLGALYIRKARHVERGELSLFGHLDSAALERQTKSLGTLSAVSPASVRPSAGLIEVLERDQYLYVSVSNNLQAVVREFVSGPTLRVMANHLWTPERSRIGLRIYEGADFDRTDMRRWQLKLIQEKEPVFNWPVAA